MGGSSKHVFPPEKQAQGCWGTEAPGQPPHLNKDGEKGDGRRQQGFRQIFKNEITLCLLKPSLKFPKV